MTTAKKFCILILLLTLFFVIQENNISLAGIEECPARETCYSNSAQDYNDCLNEANDDLTICQQDAENHYNTCATDVELERSYCESEAEYNHGERSYECAMVYISGPIPDPYGYGSCVTSSEITRNTDIYLCGYEYDYEISQCQSDKSGILQICNNNYSSDTQSCADSKQSRDNACMLIQCP